jgi:hypothetical protein
MTCDCNNFWLTFPSNINPQKQISNSLGGFISIQEWHTTIHKDKRKPKRIILINGGLDFIDRLLAIISINRLLMPPPKSKNHKESIDNFTVELFIVDHENFIFACLLRFYFKYIFYDYRVLKL